VVSLQFLNSFSKINLRILRIFGRQKVTTFYRACHHALTTNAPQNTTQKAPRNSHPPNKNALPTTPEKNTPKFPGFDNRDRRRPPSPQPLSSISPTEKHFLPLHRTLLRVREFMAERQRDVHS